MQIQMLAQQNPIGHVTLRPDNARNSVYFQSTDDIANIKKSIPEQYRGDLENGYDVYFLMDSWEIEQWFSGV